MALSFREHELFDKGAGIEQLVDTLAGGELALCALFGGGFWIGVEGDLLDRSQPVF